MERNILQIDVEDWFCDLDFDDWAKYDDRAFWATNRILDLLKASDNRATFFMLGYVAEKYPELVRRIEAEGHEVGSHGYNHKRLTDMSPEEFEIDLKQSLAVLKKILGRNIEGYRAPQFTLAQETSWAIDVLKKNDLKYDSSIFPVKTPLYGVNGAPTRPYRISSKDITKHDPEEDFIEVPLSTFTIPFTKIRIPVAGGIYLRFFPYWLLRIALKRISRKKSLVCFIHPWEIDSGKPKIKELEWNHYWGLKSGEKKFKKLLNDFKFTSTKDWIENARKRS